MLNRKYTTYLTRLFWVIAIAFLASCATANKNYHGITIGSDVAFGFGSAKLTPEGKQMIDEYAQQIIKQKRIRIAVVGHTDRIGDEQVNNALALKRANAARDQLIKNGLDPNRIVVRAVGPNEPLVECQDTNRAQLIECLAPNRRIEIFVNQTSH